jgi:hypothetical protein
MAAIWKQGLRANESRKQAVEQDARKQDKEQEA